MPQTVTPTEKQDYSAQVRRAARNKERVRLTQGDKAIAAVIPIEDLEYFERLEDYVDLLESLEATEEAIEKGGVLLWEKFKAELELESK
ncbi:MAG TPA: hypothetical protein VMC85_01340 [Desulfomonilaceae bacterium]|nr:hypothetical protein [Desulfomonilaceae bacterium]